MSAGYLLIQDLMLAASGLVTTMVVTHCDRSGQILAASQGRAAWVTGEHYTAADLGNPETGYSAPGMESLLRVGKRAAGRTWDEFPV